MTTCLTCQAAAVFTDRPADQLTHTQLVALVRWQDTQLDRLARALARATAGTTPNSNPGDKAT